MSQSAVSPPLAVPRDWRALACLAAGLLLVSDAVFLMTLRVLSLGTTLPLAMGCGLLVLGARWKAVQRWLDARPARRKAWRWLLVAACLWLCSLFAFWAVIARAAQGPAVSGAAPKAVVVLGSGTPGGKVSPMLASRLEVALAAASRHSAALVIVSGGVDFNERLSEGRIMGDYLRARGLAPERIVQEEESTSTEQNLLLSRPLLQARGISPDDPIQLVTSDFHTLRAGWIARRAGYSQVQLAGAPTPLYIRYNAWLREYFAVISGFILREFA